jgi:hypothetical protein
MSDEPIAEESVVPPPPPKKNAFIAFLKANPVAIASAVISLGSLCVAGLALRQVHRNADSAVQQLRLASQPLLYGECAVTRNDLLKLGPIPDALFIADKIGDPLQIQTIMKIHQKPELMGYEKVLPFMVYECTLANVGKGTAENIQMELKPTYVDTKTLMAYPSKITQSWTIPLLKSGDSYTIVVGDRTAATALILMPATADFDIAVTDEHISEQPIAHGVMWQQITVDNRERPKDFKDDQ